MFLIFDYQQTAVIDCQVGAPTERQLGKPTNSHTSHRNKRYLQQMFAAAPIDTACGKQLYIKH